MPGNRETEMKEFITAREKLSQHFKFLQWSSLTALLSVCVTVHFHTTALEKSCVFIFSISSFPVLYFKEWESNGKMNRIIFFTFFVLMFVTLGKKLFRPLKYAQKGTRIEVPSFHMPVFTNSWGNQKIQPTSHSVWQRQHLILEAFNNLKNHISTYALLF